MGDCLQGLFKKRIKKSGRLETSKVQMGTVTVTDLKDNNKKRKRKQPKLS
jgi:hypothetical protein